MRSLSLLTLLAGFSICSTGFAGTITYSTSGTYDGGVPSVSVGGANYTGPNEPWTMSFTVDVTPTPLTFDLVTFSVPYSDFLYTLGGSNTGLTPSSIDFVDAPENGMFELFFDANDFMIFTGPKMFAGPTATPTMLAGTFQDTFPPFGPYDNVSADALGFGTDVVVQSLTGTIVTGVADVPEPSPFLLLFGGGLALAGLRRRAA